MLLSSHLSCQFMMMIGEANASMTRRYNLTWPFYKLSCGDIILPNFTQTFNNIHSIILNDSKNISLISWILAFIGIIKFDKLIIYLQAVEFKFSVKIAGPHY